MKQKWRLTSKHKKILRIAYSSALLILVVGSISLVAVIKTKEFIYDAAFSMNGPAKTEVQPMFPVGVNPTKKEITENPLVESFLESQLSSNTPEHSVKTGWFSRLIAKLVQIDLYQNLASPITRILVIEPGERKEQVADHFSSILDWTQDEQEIFTTLVAYSSPELSEGKFFPGHYVVDKDASPTAVAQLVAERFDAEVASRYSAETQRVLPLGDAMTIASLLEREAYSFEDMRYISGVIWNRLFIDMNLQIDASLQYAKGSNVSEPWWPRVHPSDKYIDSPFNTYENNGLPPAPIANPSAEALLAALNPKDTNCIFYFHDADGGFHCAPTYEEHVALLKEYYGRGI